MLVLVEIGSGEKDFQFFVNVFSLFRNISPWKGLGSPFEQEGIMPSLVELGPVILEKKILKFHRCIFAIYYLSLEIGWVPSFE